MKRRLAPLISGVVFSGALLIASTGPLPAWQAPDNTAVNKADRDKAVPTADQGKNNLSDRDLMKHIRQDVVKDKSLSTYAHNVKIIASHGKVTLRGPVHSEDEKKAIEEHAKKYAGEGNVTNDLTVKS